VLEGVISAEASVMFDNVDSLSDNPYNPGPSDHDVVVEVTPEAYSLISQFKVIGEPKKVSDSTVRATIKVGRLENLGKIIARFGGAARVIEPKVAKEIVRDYALASLGREPLIQTKMSIE
jgi:proteasome accessory factor C